jgi:ribonuclease HI
MQNHTPARHKDTLHICSYNIGGRHSTIPPANTPNSLTPALSDLATSLKLDQDKHVTFDIFLLQELHLQVPSPDLPQHPLHLGEGVTVIYSYALANDPSAGLAICYGPSLPPPRDHLTPADLLHNPAFQGRFMLHSFTFDGKILLIALLYGFSDSSTSRSGTLLREAYLTAIRELDLLRAQAPPSTSVVLLLAGDLNTFSFSRNAPCYNSCARSKPQKRPGRTYHAKVAISEIENSKRIRHAHDILHPNTGYLTNFSKTSSGVTSTGIDHAYIDSENTHLLSSFEHRQVIRNPPLTNYHHLLAITLGNFWSRPLRGSRPRAVLKPLPSYPFRDTLFMDDTIRPLIQLAISTANSTGNWALSYDLLLGSIEAETLKYAKLSSARMKERISNLKSIISGHHSVASNPPSSQDIHTAKADLLHCYHLLQRENLYSVLNVTDLKKLLEDTDPLQTSPNTDWFDNIRTRADIAKIIPAIADGPFRNISKPHLLQAKFFNHFKKQFQPPTSQEKTERTHRLRSEHPPDFIAASPFLSDEESTNLAKPFTPQECEECLSEFESKFDSSPGKDNFPPSFFSSPTIRTPLAEFMCGLLNNAVAGSGRLPNSLYHMVIRLLHKPGRPRTSPDGYRPISLMPIFLRVLARAICKRINPLLPTLTHWQQSAYVPGRRMDHGVILLEKILNDSLDPNSTTALLQLDLMRAFDSILHSFLRKVLTHMRFPTSIIKLIMLITTSLSAQVIVNDHLTHSFPIGRGLPQGSALSAVLFILCVEPLLSYARSHPVTASGVNLIASLESVRSAILQYLGYADDIIAPLTSPAQASAWLTHFNQFEILSGLRVCLPKTSLNFIGGALWSYPSRLSTPAGDAFRQTIEANHPQFPPANILVAADFQYCGRGFSIFDLRNPDPSVTLTSSHWNKKAANILRLLAAYKHSPLKSFYQRQQYLLSHLLSKLQHLAFTSPCPPTTLIQLQKASNLFVFDQEVAPYDNNLAALPHPRGLNLVNLSHRFRAFQLSWFVQFLDGNLPPAVNSLIAASLDHFNYHTICSIDPPNSKAIAIALNETTLHNAALVDATLQLSPLLYLHPPQPSPSNLHPSTPCVLIGAITTLFGLHSNRVFTPPTAPLSSNALLCVHLEPLVFSSVILPRSLPTRSRITTPLSQTILAAECYPNWKVQDLIRGTPTSFTFDPYLAFKASPTPLHRPPGVLPEPLLRLSPKANQPPSAAITFNQTWKLATFNQLLPSILNSANVNFSSPVSSTETLNLHDSYYPLCLINDEAVSKPLRLYSVAQLSRHLCSAIISRFKPDLQIPTPFRTAHGWSHLAHNDSPYPLPYLSVTKAIFTQRSNLPPILYNRLIKVLFLMIQRPAHNSSAQKFVKSDGTTSRWLACPRCNGELSTQHRLFTCPGIQAFWEVFRKTVITVIPALVSRNILTTSLTLSNLSSCGFFPTLDPLDLQTSLTLFAIAFEAVLGVPLNPPNNSLAIPYSSTDVQNLVTSHFSSLASTVLLTKWRCLLTINHHIVTPKNPVIIVLQHGIVTTRVSALKTNTDTPLAPTTIPNKALNFLHQYFPLIYQPPADHLSTNFVFNDIGPQGINLTNFPQAIQRPPAPPTSTTPHPRTIPSVSLPTTPPQMDLTLLSRIPPNILPSSWTSTQFFTDGSKMNLPLTLSPTSGTYPVAAYAVICPNTPTLTTSSHVPALRAQTNNTAELLGAITALQQFATLIAPSTASLSGITSSLSRLTLNVSNQLTTRNYLPPQLSSFSTALPNALPHILTDSLAYVIHHATTSRSLKPNTHNFDLIKTFRTSLSALPYVILEYVPAHTLLDSWNSFWNNAADTLAKKTAMSPRNPAGIG